MSFRLFLPRPTPTKAELAVTATGALFMTGMVVLADNFKKKNTEKKTPEVADTIPDQIPARSNKL